MVKGKNFTFVTSVLRRSKWQVVAISVLLVLASALINIILFLSSDYQKNYYKEKSRLNGEDVDLLFLNIVPDNDCHSQLSATLNGIDSIKQYEIDNVVSSVGTIEYKDAVAGNNISFLSYDSAMKKQIGQYDVLESDGKEGVYLSYAFKKDCGYKIGQNISINLGAKDYIYKISGFYNNVDTGTVNCTDIVVLMDDNNFNKVALKHGLSYRISVLLNEPESADWAEADIAKKISEECPMLIFLGSSNYDKISTSRYVIATLFEAIISVAAILMIAVILATIAITLSNYIRNNIKNLGALKAIGYTSNGLILPIVGGFSLIAFVMSLLGTAFSYALLPILNSALEKQVGIPYKIHFLFDQLVITVLICVFVSAVSSFFSALKVKQIYPINAIRDSESNKRFKQETFSLEKTHLGLNTAISIKSLISGKVHGIILFLSMIVISFLLGFSAFTYQNVILNQNPILDLVCGQRTDSVLSVSSSFEEQLKFELDKNDLVEKYYLYSSFPITPLDLPKIYANVIDETFQPKEQLCIQGYIPIADDEIAINRTYADKYGFVLGDSIYFEAKNDTIEYVVTGMIQGAFNTGYDCYLTKEGYSKISTLPYISYNVDLKDGVDIYDFNAEISNKCPLISVSNYQEAVESASSSYVKMLIIATIIIVLLSFVIAAFILYILISVLLANKHREHGILRALGFVTRDIVYQTVFFNIPSCVLGTVIGLLLSRNGAAKLLAFALKGIGIFSFGTPTRFVYLFVAGISIVLFVVIVSVLMSWSVKKITPHQLFNKE